MVTSDWTDHLRFPSRVKYILKTFVNNHYSNECGAIAILEDNKVYRLLVSENKATEIQWTIEPYEYEFKGKVSNIYSNLKTYTNHFVEVRDE
jgi:hypothetical protein